MYLMTVKNEITAVYFPRELELPCWVSPRSFPGPRVMNR